MRTLLLVIALSLPSFGQEILAPIMQAPPSGGGGGHTLVSGFPVIALGSSATTAKNTTGATLLVLECATTSSVACTISDQASGAGATLNTWSSLTLYNGRSQFFYVLNPTTNANHTFKSTTGSGPPSIQVWAFTGTFTAFDVGTDVGGGFAPLTTFNIGSITPSQTGEVCVSAVTSNNAAITSAVANNGFSTASIQNLATNEIQAGAYLLSSGNTAFNLQWTMSNNTDWSGGIGCWK